MHCNKIGWFRNWFSGVQLVEKCLGLLQIERVKPFGDSHRPERAARGLGAAFTCHCRCLTPLDAAAAPPAVNCAIVTSMERLGQPRPVNMACHIKEPQAVYARLGFLSCIAST